MYDKGSKKETKMAKPKNTSSDSSQALGKNERFSATRKAELRRGNINLIKSTKEGISIIEKNLKSFDCALISVYDSKLSEEEIGKTNFIFGLKVMDKGYLDYQIKDTLETQNNLVHCIVDSEGTGALKEDLEAWGREYNQGLVSFLSKRDSAYEILLSEHTEKEISNYKKIKVCEKQIGKILKSNFTFEFSTVVKTSGPTNNMGRWYFSSLLKSIRK